jgi:ankyrin repeat protein
MPKLHTWVLVLAALSLDVACTSRTDVALVDAALSGELSKVQALLDRGANIEATAYDGLTPLDAAAKEGHLDVVKYLLEKGAPVNDREHTDRTPLVLAAVYEHTDCVVYLISRGGEIRGSAQWRQGLLDSLSKHNKTELYQIVKQQIERENSQR